MVWHKFADLTAVHSASIIRAMSSLFARTCFHRRWGTDRKAFSRVSAHGLLIHYVHDEVTSTFETSVNFYRNIWRNNVEGSSTICQKRRCKMGNPRGKCFYSKNAAVSNRPYNAFRSKGTPDANSSGLCNHHEQTSRKMVQHLPGLFYPTARCRMCEAFLRET